jgi:hypothetical protein
MEIRGASWQASCGGVWVRRIRARRFGASRRARNGQARGKRSEAGGQRPTKIGLNSHPIQPSVKYCKVNFCKDGQASRRRQSVCSDSGAPVAVSTTSRHVRCPSTASVRPGVLRWRTRADCRERRSMPRCVSCRASPRPRPRHKVGKIGPAQRTSLRSSTGKRPMPCRGGDRPCRGSRLCSGVRSVFSNRRGGRRPVDYVSGIPCRPPS